MQDESLAIIASTPVLASSHHVSFAKENAYPRQQSFPNSCFNLRDGGYIGAGSNWYVGNASVRSSAGGGGTSSPCLASCPIHYHISHPFVQEPLHPIQNPYGSQLRVDKP